MLLHLARHVPGEQHPIRQRAARGHRMAFRRRDQRRLQSRGSSQKPRRAVGLGALERVGADETRPRPPYGARRSDARVAFRPRRTEFRARQRFRSRLAARQSCAYWLPYCSWGKDAKQRCRKARQFRRRPKLLPIDTAMAYTAVRRADAGRSAVGVLGDEPVALGLGEPNRQPGEHCRQPGCHPRPMDGASMPKSFRFAAPQQSLLAAIGLARLAAIVRSLGPHSFRQPKVEKRSVSGFVVHNGERPGTAGGSPPSTPQR